MIKETQQYDTVRIPIQDFALVRGLADTPGERLAVSRWLYCSEAYNCGLFDCLQEPDRADVKAGGLHKAWQFTQQLSQKLFSLGLPVPQRSIRQWNQYSPIRQRSDLYNVIVNEWLPDF